MLFVFERRLLEASLGPSVASTCTWIPWTPSSSFISADREPAHACWDPSMRCITVWWGWLGDALQSCNPDHTKMQNRSPPLPTSRHYRGLKAVFLGWSQFCPQNCVSESEMDWLCPGSWAQRRLIDYHLFFSRLLQHKSQKRQIPLCPDRIYILYKHYHLQGLAAHWWCFLGGNHPTYTSTL